MSARQRTPISARSRPFGFNEWFRPGEHARVERALDGMCRAGASHLRTSLSWADYQSEGGQAWYDWLIPTLSGRLEVLPCIHATPHALSRSRRTTGAPQDLHAYAGFVDHVLTRYGRHFPRVELWNEPNNLLEWEWRSDPEWHLFAEMLGAAAQTVVRRGWKTVLAAPFPFDPHWLGLMGERGVLDWVSAAGFHGFPGTWDDETASWRGWDAHLTQMRSILDRHNPQAEIWVTATGYSTWSHDEAGQIERFLAALSSLADRIYWSGWQDLADDAPAGTLPGSDPRIGHLGVVDAGGEPKLLGRLLQEGGIAKVERISRLARPNIARAGRGPVAVIGGAGFIGSNLADSLLADGEEVIVIDNLSRPGVERNLEWLRSRGREHLHSHLGDARDAAGLAAAVADARAVFHLAAQVAVTTSLARPDCDFAINAAGTFTVLETLRRSGKRTPLLFSSTNKVYGSLEEVQTIEIGDCHVPVDDEIRRFGIGEGRNLDFCTPYGCSKGVADQYVLDYAKSYGLPTAVLRMSCIYGPRQMGTEDQGWVAHFLMRALAGDPITIYGNGRQVRDILFVTDAVAAYRAVLANIGRVQGQAFNLGGGPANAISLKMLLKEIGRQLDREVAVRTSAPRAGDQVYFVADTRKLAEAVQWQARIGWRQGVSRLADWLRQQTAPQSDHELAEPRRVAL